MEGDTYCCCCPDHHLEEILEGLPEIQSYSALSGEEIGLLAMMAGLRIVVAMVVVVVVAGAS